VFPHIHISLRPDGWDRDVFVELELPEELSVKYLNKGRSHKTTIETTSLLQAMASHGVNVSTIADTLHIWPKPKGK
jgi:hypothetical protein